MTQDHLRNRSTQVRILSGALSERDGLRSFAGLSHDLRRTLQCPKSRGPEASPAGPAAPLRRILPLRRTAPSLPTRCSLIPSWRWTGISVLGSDWCWQVECSRFFLPLLASEAGAEEVWSSGEIAGLGATQVTPKAVNEIGVVVGDAYDSNGDRVAFHWYDDVMTELPRPGVSRRFCARHQRLRPSRWPRRMACGLSGPRPADRLGDLDGRQRLLQTAQLQPRPGESPAGRRGRVWLGGVGINNQGDIVGQARGVWEHPDPDSNDEFPVDHAVIATGTAWSVLVDPAAPETPTAAPGSCSPAAGHTTSTRPGRYSATSAGAGTWRSWARPVAARSRSALNVSSPAYNYLSGEGHVTGRPFPDVDSGAQIFDGSSYTNIDDGFNKVVADPRSTALTGLPAATGFRYGGPIWGE